MREVLLGRAGVRVAQVPSPTVQRGYVVVSVAYSFISSGTEAQNIEVAKAPLLQRARQRPDQVALVLAKLRDDGVKRTVRSVRSRLEAELPLGYSCSGTVVEVGSDVDGLAVGQPVACGGAGWASHADVALVPKNLVVPVPEGCDLRQASAVSLGAIALQGVRRADARLGETVAVIGLGLIGQLTVQILRASGCRVLGVEPDQRRSDLARSLGAHLVVGPDEAGAVATIEAETGGHGADAVIVTASSRGDEVIRLAIKAARRKGRVVVVGDVGLGLTRSPFYEKELDLLISCSYGPGRYDPGYEEGGLDYPLPYVRWTEGRNMESFLGLVASGAVNVDALIEGEFGLDEAESAYTDLRESQPRPLGLVFRAGEAGDGPADRDARDDRGVRNASRPAPQPAPRAVPGVISVAVVGAGEFARAVQLPALAGLPDQFRLRAVVAASGRSAQGSADRFGADYATTSFEQVLEDGDVDAVVICTRHHLHATQVRLALQAGKHVLCEKPVALEEEELGSVLSAAEPQPASSDGAAPILMVGFNRRFSPSGRALRSALMDRPGPFVATYRVNASPLARDHWARGPEGGGRIIGEVCHMVDLLTHLAGSLPVEVWATTPHGGALSGDDNAVISLHFGSGALGVIVYSTAGRGGSKKERLEVAHAGRTFVIDDFRGLERSDGRARAKPWKVPSQDKGHAGMLQAFAQAVREGRSPTTVPEIEAVARATFLADRIVRLGSPA